MKALPGCLVVVGVACGPTLRPGNVDTDSGVDAPPDVACSVDCSPPASDAPRVHLLENLLAQMDDAVLFGQESFNITGVNADGTSWIATEASVDRSDARSVAGDHPAVLGFDAWDFAVKPADWSPTPAAHAAAARYVHAHGGVVEMAFHMPGCATPSFEAAGNEACLCRVANDDELARSWFLSEYARVADAIVRFEKDRIPIVFRPLHEHHGGWFWWGEPYWSCERYVANPKYTGAAAFERVFRTVVTYLRDRRELDNLLFAYSPGLADDEAAYLRGYPGDAYVDILGTDVYYGGSPSFASQTASYGRQLAMVSRLAEARHKVAALTEVGNTLLATPLGGATRWYTEHLLPLVTSPGVRLAYAMTWVNRASNDFFVPYPGHPDADDFRAFVDHPATALLADAPRFDAPPTRGYPVCRSCTADPDGDRWGWEDAASCRVASWCLVPDVIVCRRCDADPDGDGWGWENDRSCVVLASCE